MASYNPRNFANFRPNSIIPSYFSMFVWKEYCCFYLVSFSIYFKHRNIFVSVDFISRWMSPYTFCLKKNRKEKISFHLIHKLQKKNSLTTRIPIWEHVYAFMLHLPCVSWELWRSSCTWDRTRTGRFWASGHTPQGTGWNTMWTFRSGRSPAFWSCTPAGHSWSSG